MRLGPSKWIASAICAGLLAACGGGYDDLGGGGGEKTFSSPADGAALAAAMTAVFNKVGGSTTTGGKSAAKRASIAPKAAVACPQGGTLEQTSDDTATTYAADGTILFDQCRNRDDQGGDLNLDGQLVLHCGDANQTATACSDFDLTFGQNITPLVVDIINSSQGIDLSGAFYDFDVTTQDNGDGTSTATLDGRAVVTDNSTYSCGDADLTLDTTEPLVIDDDTGTVTDGTLDLDAADGSGAHVVFNQDGSQTVTVNGTTDTFTSAELAAICH